LARSGKRRILRQESVPGVNGVGLAALRGRDQLVNTKVAVFRAIALKGDGLIGVSDIRRRPVAVRVNGNRRKPHLATCPHYANGDLASIGDKDLHRNVTTQAGI
jgi:hypothetical protein